MICFARRGRRERRVLFHFRVSRWRWSVANFVTTRGRRGVRLAVNVERKSGGTGLATDDTDATDIHRLPCASVICANRCYLCPLWANLHVYVCCLGKLYYLCP